MKFNANSLNNRVTRQFYISNFFPFLYSLMLIELQCNNSPVDYIQQLKSIFFNWGINYYKVNNLYLSDDVYDLLTISSINEELGASLRESYITYKNDSVFKDFIIQALDLVKEYPYRFLKTHTTDELSPKTNETSCDEVQI
ncbi:MAG TPA: hypothetical protein DEP51_05285 [Clostridiales bacterium]|nr:hypothetical protein [Clostridiales bacterium]